MAISDSEYTKLAKSRKPKYARDDVWIREFLQDSLVGHIATRWETQPFITPSTFWYDEEAHVIYFHSNITGRVRNNAEKYPEVCFEASRVGMLLPSNVALEFSIQYASVIAYGTIRLVDEQTEKRRGLNGLLEKYFPDMKAGDHYRPITAEELSITTVYAIDVKSWSGKENWKEKAAQSPDWRPLPEAPGA
jgi:nitroimidazol reductase NimA-like FMN-containing flavoprotein (pyridoxamine 5'-phosphate oxidase superfamily)